MKIVKGWRKIDNHRGYKCDNRAKSYCPKKQYGEHCMGLLSPKAKNDDKGRKISPEFPTE